MKTFVGIDLGSTTTKAVLLDENEQVLGRGITNSRSNYDTACRVAGQEAAIDARFSLFRRAFEPSRGGNRVGLANLTDDWAFSVVEFFEEGVDKFLQGSFAGDYQRSLLAKFETYLPETPNW